MLGSAVSRNGARASRRDGEKVGARRKKRKRLAKRCASSESSKCPCLASLSRKNTRLDCADCCTCVAVKGGQAHEDAGGSAPDSTSREGLKRKRPVLDSRLRRLRDDPQNRLNLRYDRQAFLYKNCSIAMDTPQCRHSQCTHSVSQGQRTRMKVNCCWNDTHVSTMTEDRANPDSPGRPVDGAQSLAGSGIRAIARSGEGA